MLQLGPDRYDTRDSVLQKGYIILFYHVRPGRTCLDTHFTFFAIFFACKCDGAPSAICERVLKAKHIPFSALERRTTEHWFVVLPVSHVVVGSSDIWSSKKVQKT